MQVSFKCKHEYMVYKKVILIVCDIFVPVYKSRVGRSGKYEMKVNSELKSIKKTMIEKFMISDIDISCDIAILHKTGESFMPLKGDQYAMSTLPWLHM